MNENKHEPGEAHDTRKRTAAQLILDESILEFEDSEEPEESIYG